MKEKNDNALTASSSALSKESTVQLVRRIVESSDRIALNVLMEDRKLFLLKEEKPLSLPEFLLKLRYRLAPAPPEKYDAVECELAECAYDLTLAKYTNFPDSENEKTSSVDHFLKRGVRVDCKNYYRAFLSQMEREMGTGDLASQAEEESIAGRTLKRLVWRAFSLSKMECRRISPFSVRYPCKVNGRNINLWYPSHMTSGEFKAWLEARLQDVDPDEPNMKEHLQSIIDNELIKGHHVQLNGNEAGHDPWGDDPSRLQEFYEGLAVVGSLADAVAEEKVKNIDTLRRSIKVLGPSPLKRLILQIFTAVADDDYEPSRLADEYHISRPTFSRFAGSKWFVQQEENIKEDNKEGERKQGENKAEENTVMVIPDLWRNTAQVLRKNAAFMETVLSSGIAGRLQEVLDFLDREGGNVNDK